MKELKRAILAPAVFLLTIAVYSILWIDVPHVAESHILGMRFTFSWVMLGLSVVGLLFAWANFRRFSFALQDGAVGAFLLYLFGVYVWGEGAQWPMFLVFLLGMLYWIFRHLSVSLPSARRVMLSAFLLVVLVECIYGFCQLYGWLPSGHSLYRLTGSFFNPGPYSGFLVIALPIALDRVLEWWGKEPMDLRPWEWRRVWAWEELSIAWVCLVLIIMLLPAGMSRGSWLAALVGCGVVAVHRGYLRPVGRWIALHRKLAVAIAVTGVFVLGGLLVGIYSMKKDSADGRLLIWKVSISVLAAHPWTGVGPGHWAGAYGEAQEAYFASGQATPQEEFVAGAPEYTFNEYLQIATETGLLGFLLFLLILAIALWGAFGADGAENGAIRGGLCSFLVFAFFSYPFSVLPLAVTFVFLLALAVPHGRKPGRSWGPVSVSVVGLFCTAVIFLICLEWRHAYVDWREEQTYFNMEIYEKTVDEYGRLYDYLSQEPRFLFEYGQCLSKTAQYEKSNNVLREGLKYSSDPMFYNIMGKNAQALGRTDEAADYFRRAADRVPNRLYPLYLLACLYFDTGQYDKAREVSVQLLAKEPKVMSDAVLEMKQHVRERLKECEGK